MHFWIESCLIQMIFQQICPKYCVVDFYTHQTKHLAYSILRMNKSPSNYPLPSQNPLSLHYNFFYIAIKYLINSSIHFWLKLNWQKWPQLSYMPASLRRWFFFYFNCNFFYFLLFHHTKLKWWNDIEKKSC